MLCVSVPVVAGWLSAIALSCETVAAGSVWKNMETESITNNSISDDHSLGDNYKQEKNPKERQQGLRQEADETETEGEVLQQLNELLRLQPVVVQLAESVETHEAHLVLQEFWKSVERAKHVRQLLTDSSNPWGPPESAVKKALNKGLSALSEVYEMARQHGLRLVRETRGVQPVRDFSYQELKIMEGYLGSPLVQALENHMASLRFSCRAFAWKLEETEASIAGMPRVGRLEDGRLLEALAANLKFIHAAHKAATIGRQSAEEVTTSAIAVAISQATRVYKDCRDLLQERRALSKAERQRQQSLAQEESVAALQQLDTVDDLLNRGEELLQQYRGGIEEMQKEREIVVADAVRQQAEDVGKELKAVLDVAVSRLECSSAVINDDKKVESVYKALASRATREAADASRRVSDIQMELEARPLLGWSSSEIMQVEEENASRKRVLINQSMLNLLTESLEQIEKNAKAAHLQASTAATAISEDNEVGLPGRVLMAAARNAAATADRLVGNAEILWLHAQLLESLECDLRVSVNLARIGAAAAAWPTETATKGKQRWQMELPSQHKVQVEALQKEVHATKSLARSHWTARDLALTAATMKHAAVGIATLIQQQQLKQTANLIP
ncbi:hypothetical protein, conserved [Eimeria praecox]|uniref:Uncharacterized protein n=1 Tax=Eimeria praecox TaxID=51316 RepID=U6G697_9EIME|nr:hypothetical protein, conserved [Eimeria praecox]